MKDFATSSIDVKEFKHSEVKHIIYDEAFRWVIHQENEVFNSGNGPGKINLNLKSNIISHTTYYSNKEDHHNKLNQFNQRTTVTLIKEMRSSTLEKWALGKKIVSSSKYEKYEYIQKISVELILPTLHKEYTKNIYANLCAGCVG